MNAAATNEKNPYRVYLREEQIPTQYYNLRSDMPGYRQERVAVFG